MTRSANLSARLAAEKLQHVALLERLGARLHATLDTEICEGSATPSRDWCRAAARYQAGLKDLTTEQLEVAKLQLLRERMGGGQLSDEEYELGLAELAGEAIKAMQPDVLQKALTERGLRVVTVDDDEESD